jgi:hypothetical protein
VVRAEGRSQEIFEKYLERKKIARRIVLLTPHFMSIPTIIGKTDLVVTLPHAIGLFFSQAGANIKVMEPPLPIPRIELRQHWHRNAHHDPKNKWLRRLVAGLVQRCRRRLAVSLCLRLEARQVIFAALQSRKTVQQRRSPLSSRRTAREEWGLRLEKLKTQAALSPASHSTCFCPSPWRPCSRRRWRPDRPGT